jgi:hypothetical protein
MEEWRQIADFPDYEVSNQGRVRRGDRILSQHNDGRRGYLQVGLMNGTQSTKKVHRLVGLAFVPNPENKRVLDHIDRNKANNVVSNLRWRTDSENQINTDDKTENRHIYKNGKGFIVRVRRDYVCLPSKHFKTLDEAKAYRDGLLTQL